MTDKSEGVRLSDEQRLDWLRLIRSDNVGPRTFRALINHYGGARAALSAVPDLARRGGAKGPARIPSREDAAREFKAAKTLGVSFVALGEPDYPRRLQMIDDAPPLLAVRGNAAALNLPAVAVVGARNASAAGVRFAERLARDLAKRVLPSSRGSRAASTPPRIARVWRAAPSPSLPAAMTASIRPNTPNSPARFWRKARARFGNALRA